MTTITAYFEAGSYTFSSVSIYCLLFDVEEVTELPQLHIFHSFAANKSPNTLDSPKINQHLPHTMMDNSWGSSSAIFHFIHFVCFKLNSAFRCFTSRIPDINKSLFWGNRVPGMQSCGQRTLYTTWPGDTSLSQFEQQTSIAWWLCWLRQGALAGGGSTRRWRYTTALFCGWSRRISGRSNRNGQIRIDRGQLFACPDAGEDDQNYGCQSDKS